MPAVLHALDQFGEDIGGISQQADRLGLALGAPRVDHRQRLLQCPRLGIDIAGADAEIDAGLVTFDGKAAGPGHHGGEGLRAAHAAKPPGQDPFAREVSAIVLAPRLGKGFIGSLHNALSSNVNPRSGRHLAVHRQTLFIQFVEMVPSRPMWHEVGIRDQNARRVLVGAEDAHGLARLHQKRLVVVQGLEGGDDLVEILPRAGGAADAPVHHQFMGVFGHVGMQVVHQHPHWRLGHPAFCGDRGAGRGIDVAGVMAGHGVLTAAGGLR